MGRDDRSCLQRYPRQVISLRTGKLSSPTSEISPILLTDNFPKIMTLHFAAIQLYQLRVTGAASKGGPWLVKTEQVTKRTLVAHPSQEQVREIETAPQVLSFDGLCTRPTHTELRQSVYTCTHTVRTRTCTHTHTHTRTHMHTHTHTRADTHTHTHAHTHTRTHYTHTRSLSINAIDRIGCYHDCWLWFHKHLP